MRHSGASSVATQTEIERPLRTKDAAIMRMPHATNRLAAWTVMLLCHAPAAHAQHAPWARPEIPISGHDRVYAANQTSNTVSVIDPFSNQLLGVIRLGDPLPAALSPLYAGQLLVHGLGYSPDGKALAVVSIAS